MTTYSTLAKSPSPQIPEILDRVPETLKVTNCSDELDPFISIPYMILKTPKKNEVVGDCYIHNFSKSWFSIIKPTQKSTRQRFSHPKKTKKHPVKLAVFRVFFWLSYITPQVPIGLASHPAP